MSEFSKILVVDDEDVIRQTLQDMLEDLGYEVLEADNGKSAISIIADEKPALVITDLRMPEMSGIELIQHCQQHYPDLLTVVISSVSQIGDAIDAMRLGAFDYLVKPLKGFDVLEKTINKALKKYAETKSLASQQLQKEQEIRRQVKAIEQEFLYSVINAISDPIYVKNDTAQCIVVNDAMCAWIGKSRDDLLGHTDEAFFLG
jgi:DNA-binding NtrC family response regulator